MKKKYAIISKSILFTSEIEKANVFDKKKINQIKFHYKLNPMRVPCLKIDSEFRVYGNNSFYYSFLKNQKDNFLVMLPDNFNEEIMEELLRENKMEIYDFNGLEKKILKPSDFFSTISFKSELSESQISKLKEDIEKYYKSLDPEGEITQISFNRDLDILYFFIKRIGNNHYIKYHEFIRNLVKEYGLISLLDGYESFRGLSF
ncbi:hypothetical protein [Dokdonia sp.]|uniref:hypothetical protein n=1 Tax=Dokdonia sp. TaxID=2024995 RepID=UPI00326501C2